MGLPAPLTELLRSKEVYNLAATNELLVGLVTGLNCLLYKSLNVTDAAAVQLPDIPDQAVKALLVVEADPTSTDLTAPVLRYTEDGITVPTALVGMPLLQYSIYEVGGIRRLPLKGGGGFSVSFQSAIDNFQVIGIEAGKTHSLKIQYFG